MRSQKYIWSMVSFFLMGVFLSFGQVSAAASEKLQQTAAVQEYRNISDSQVDGDIVSGKQLSGWVETESGKYYYSPLTGEMQTGFQEIEGETYYFLPETGEMQVGMCMIGKNKFYFLPPEGKLQKGVCEIEGQTYYFSEESGAMLSGWQEIEGQTCYFSKESGEMQTGWQKIDGKRYYFSKSSGEMQTGWQEIGGKKYYAAQNGVFVSGWKKIGNWKYYFLPKNNSMVTGACKIDNIYYIFDSKGRLSKADGIHLVRIGERRYCAGAGGRAVSGWQMIKKKYYFASKTGEVKRNTTYQGITLTDTGAASNDARTQAVITARQVVGSITNSRMTKGQKLKACWSYVTSRSFRYAPKYPDVETSGWQRRTAYEMLTTKSGNCYSFACAFAALASEVGYKPEVICGRIRGSRDGAADGYTRHAWVRMNGLYYDPEGQYAGWMRGIYGAAGYPVPHKVQSVVAY